MANRRGQLIDGEAQATWIVASSHDAIVGTSRAGLITSCNPAAAAMYGRPARDIIGRPAEEFIAPGHRDTEAALLARIVAGEEVDPYRTERVGRDGTPVEVSASISPILDAAGVIVGAATAMRKVNGLQQAHDRFEARTSERRVDLQDAAVRLEARADQQRAEVQHASERFEAQVKVQRRDASAAADRSEALVDVQRQEVTDATDRFEAEVLQERVDVQAAQERSDQELAAERASADAEREHLEGQLQQSRRLEVLGQLAGGVAHDFNNLLAVILNYGSFVAEELTAGPDADLPAAARDVEQIQLAARRATGLTHQLLAFARREIARPTVINLNEVVTEVHQMLERTLGEDVVLRTTLADDLWPVLADVGQIEQILVNLAVNARDAMSGGGALTIETANIAAGAGSRGPGSAAQAGRRVQLRVCDTGIGMTPDVVAHVFEPFYTTKASGTGTGLGLATVYGIVLQAEATIDIDSRPGAGTRITILIPVTDEVARPVEAETTQERTPTGETVLVVEDEEALREVTERIFSRSGYRVLTAPHGAAALELAAAYDDEIHLLVTDVVMPNMLGKEVAERMRLIKRDIKVLYMSGYAKPVLASQGRLDPDVHLVEKPFTAAALIATAGQILNGRPHSG